MISVAKDADLTLREILNKSAVKDVPEAEEILRKCILRSKEIRYGFLDGELACMWGLIPPTVLSDAAYLWLLTTNIVAEHKFLFIRYSQRYIEEALRLYPVLVGDVVAGNESAMQWLKWLGAEFQALANGKVSFVIRRKEPR